MKNFLENVYGILFDPKNTIEKLIETQPIWQAFSILFALSVVSALLGIKTGFHSTYDVVFFLLNILYFLFSSVFIWFTLAGFFELTARIFREENNFKALLSLIGFSLIPWIFVAPLMLIQINIPLVIISTILEITVWLWSIVLVFMSVKQLYKLSVKKTLLFFVLPLLGALVIINWISQLSAILKLF